MPKNGNYKLEVEARLTKVETLLNELINNHIVHLNNRVDKLANKLDKGLWLILTVLLGVTIQLGLLFFK